MKPDKLGEELYNRDRLIISHATTQLRYTLFWRGECDFRDPTEALGPTLRGVLPELRDRLQAALAGLEKKRQQAAAVERMRDELLAGLLPDELRPLGFFREQTLSSLGHRHRGLGGQRQMFCVISVGRKAGHTTANRGTDFLRFLMKLSDDRVSFLIGQLGQQHKEQRILATDHIDQPNLRRQRQQEPRDVGVLVRLQTQERQRSSIALRSLHFFDQTLTKQLHRSQLVTNLLKLRVWQPEPAQSWPALRPSWPTAWPRCSTRRGWCSATRR